MPLPDPSRSHAVLIGVHDYRHLAALPGVAAGVARLAELLRDPTVWGLPRGNVTVLPGDASADDVLRAVRGAGRAATDTLLVYFAGHGQREPRSEQLYLALADADRYDVTIGALPERELRRMVRREGRYARRHITLIDSCYSGLAIPMGGSATVLERPDQVRLLVESKERNATGPGGGDEDFGGYVLTSASGTQRSFTLPGGYPEFTGALIEVLDKGIAGAGPTLSVPRVWRRVREQRARATPQLNGLNIAEEEPWVRNRAHDAGRDAVPPRRIVRAEAAPMPPAAAPAAGFPFDTVQGGGYRIRAVKEQLDDVLAKVRDPRRGWQAQAPHFRTVSGRWFWGYDMRQVDAHIERQRAEPTEPADALRLLLARQGVSVVPGAEGSSRVREKCGVPGTERLIGHHPSRFDKSGTIAFTDSHLCLYSSSGLLRIPYSALDGMVVDTSYKEVDTGVVNDQTVILDKTWIGVTQVTFGHRTLRFAGGRPEPVQQVLCVFRPAVADLRRRHPEWFR
ncbi:caspase family protein [Streptomyces sp. NPDC046881]|uniref:caspase family protein n=1 Tax=Streptomyces sp. NPDC046881 TaxID=3155374 RepID=UPI0033E3CE61